MPWNLRTPQNARSPCYAPATHPKTHPFPLYLATAEDSTCVLKNIPFVRSMTC
jgi:hypothetical protein